MVAQELIAMGCLEANKGSNETITSKNSIVAALSGFTVHCRAVEKVLDRTFRHGVGLTQPPGKCLLDGTSP